MAKKNTISIFSNPETFCEDEMSDRYLNRTVPKVKLSQLSLNTLSKKIGYINIQRINQYAKFHPNLFIGVSITDYKQSNRYLLSHSHCV